MNIQDRKKSLTAEELRQRYNFEDISKNKKAIQMQKDELVNTNEILNNFVEATTQNLQELQDQVDGNITTWFYSGVPTLSNEPAVEWTTDDEKINHLGDLYYDQNTGYAYRWAYIDSNYVWTRIIDADVVEALAVANAAQDTADSKRRVFVVQPTPPYDIGDIWIKDDTDLYRCKTATVEGGTYNPSHWILATNYTDDTVALAAQQALNEFKTEVEETYSTNAELITTANSISSRVEEVYTYTTTVENKTNDLDNQLTDITTTTQSKSGGNELYIEDALARDVINYSVDGVCEQDGTPTPSSPQEVKTIPSIVNLFDINSYTTTTENGTFTILDNDYVQFINNTGNAFIVDFDTINVTGNTVYTLTTEVQSNGDNKRTYIFEQYDNNNNKLKTNYFRTNSTITTENTTSYLKIRLTTDNTNTQDNFIVRISLEKGNVAHEYISYGHYARVKVTGKNLLDTSTAQSGYYNVNAISTSQNWYIQQVPVKPNTTYYLSGNNYDNTTAQIWLIDKNKNRLSTVGNYKNTHEITTTSTTAYIGVSIADYDGTADMNTIMLEEGSTATVYEEYKERQVLIDLKKENLFDKNNPNVLNAYINAYKVITSSDGDRTVYIPCKPNTTYTITKSLSTPTNQNKFRVSTYSDIPSNGDTGIDYIGYSTGTEVTAITLTTSSTANYLAIFCWNTSSTSTFDEMLNSLNVYESNNPTPYYELCKIEDYKDILTIDNNGNCSITKYIGKRVFNGSENWKLSGTDTFYIEQDGYPSGTHDYLTMSNYYIYSTWNNRTNSDYNTGLYRNGGWSVARLFIRNKDYTSINNFKTWLSTHNTDVYYVLATPETITLPNTQIPLYEGINHVTFVDDLETNTSVTYYRQTPLSSTYATQQQLNDVSTEKSQEIRTTRNEVIEEINSQYLKISAFNETLNDGVPIVRTETGYTFDIDGLKIEKSDNDVKSQLDNDGLSVKYKGTDILTARSAGVNTVNMTVNKFYIQRPIRMEKTKSISDGSSVGLGFYYIGE